ncbi:MAG TPA: hypothetical protein VE825_14965, partial [Terriglobales bacterium]|nr:hypothetical protein [Terriglobales bacterium]
MANEKKKPEEFVVTDRRKFTEEGERRPDAHDTAELDASQMPAPPEKPPQGGAKVVREVASAADLAGTPAP